LSRFTAAGECEFTAGRAGYFRQKARPQPYEQATLRSLVDAVQSSE
jgi:hypothetical protein